MSVPRVVVAAPGSGHGKTTVATGLMAALGRRGLAVSGHKVGPDYIDPGYHALATGRPGRNLDPFLQGEHRVVPLFLHGAAVPVPADVAVVEGVMGLFDGVVGGDGYASTAHVAALLQAPVVLVLDASATGRSAAATVHGFATFDPAVRLGGVVLNKVGSDRHERELRAAVEATGAPVLGALRRDDAVGVPSRHLGLVPAAERSREALDVVDRLAVLVEAGVDVPAVLSLARSASDLPGTPWCPADEVPAPPGGPPRPVVAVAGGAAFTFSYAETCELLDAAGLDVVVVDPLRDTELPAGAAALVLGGGFPEVYAEGLSRNKLLRGDVRDFADGGGTLLAECAGLLYLARELDGQPMCGVLPASARMSPRLSLGYRSAVAKTSSPLVARGEPVRGHEFHRTVVEPRSGAAAWEWSVDGGPTEAEGFVTPTLHASYLHVHWAGHPAMAARLAGRLHAVAS